MTFQNGMVESVEKHARKGRLVHVEGKLQTRKWKDADDNDRYATEILVVPGGRIQFLDKPANGSAPVPAAEAPSGGSDMDDEIPF